MSVTLTEKAAKQVQKFIADGDFGEDAFLRVGVAGGGCSGFNYSLNIAEDFDEMNDNKMEQHGVNVVVDKKSSLFLDGTTVDWFESLEKRGFTFDNPNAVKSCGCGSSFQA